VILFLLAIASLWQIDQMHPVWLTPILGSGLVPIARGSALCGGYASLYPAGVWLFLQGEPEEIEPTVRQKAVLSLPIAGAAAMMFLLFYGMLTPNIPAAPHLRSFAMERLLTGGGRSTSVHFPSLISWYAMLIIASVFSVLCTTNAIKLLLPKKTPLFCAVVSAFLCLLWTPVRMFWKHGEDLLVFANVIVVTLSLLVLFVWSKISERRQRREKD